MGLRERADQKTNLDDLELPIEAYFGSLERQKKDHSDPFTHKRLPRSTFYIGVAHQHLHFGSGQSKLGQPPRQSGAG